MFRPAISILLPSYNNSCYTLVAALKAQADSIAGLTYEIIVADDGSRDQVAVISNLRINELQHCRYIRRRENVGRSAIRNFLASEAKGDRLLFLDSDVTIVSDSFISAYLATDAEVANGGVTVVGAAKPRCLRYVYEKHSEPFHTAERRAEYGYRNFHTANFMAHRDVFSRCRFDESLRGYGFEDLLFGFCLETEGIRLLHIDNPVGLDIDESNVVFVRKTEESLRTLRTLRPRLGDSVRIIRIAGRIEKCRLLWTVRLFHKIFGSLLRRNLTGSKPFLPLFNIYKLGYYASL